MSNLNFYLGVRNLEPPYQYRNPNDYAISSGVKIPRWLEKLQKKFRGDIYADEWYVTDVVSTNLDRLAYNYDKGLMAVEFLSGRMYLYGTREPVPPNFFEELINPKNNRRSHGVEFYALFRRHNQDSRYGYELIDRFPEG